MPRTGSPSKKGSIFGQNPTFDPKELDRVYQDLGRQGRVPSLEEFLEAVRSVQPEWQKYAKKHPAAKSPYRPKKRKL